MVLLTMTSSMVEALEKIQSPGTGPLVDILAASQEETKNGDTETKNDTAEKSSNLQSNCSEKRKESTATEPVLDNPKIGNPISHGQVVDLSKQMKEQQMEPCRLEVLLKGSRIYIPPPPTKPEPVSQSQHHDSTSMIGPDANESCC